VIPLVAALAPSSPTANSAPQDPSFTVKGVPKYTRAKMWLWARMTPFSHLSTALSSLNVSARTESKLPYIRKYKDRLSLFFSFYLAFKPENQLEKSGKLRYNQYQAEVAR